MVSDRDYLFEGDRAERVQKGNAQPGQEWIIWERQEIENYLLDPAPLRRLWLKDSSGLPILESLLSGLEAKIDECVEKSKETVLDKLMNRFHEQDRKRTPAPCRQLATEFLRSEWIGDRRFELCDAKTVVLPCLREWAQCQGGSLSKILSVARIASEFTKEEIPREIQAAADRLLRFAGLDQ